MLCASLDGISGSHGGSVSSFFGGTFILFSILTVPIYILTNHVGEFSFLHVFTSICYLWTFFLGIFTLFIFNTKGILYQDIAN